MNMRIPSTSYQPIQKPIPTPQKKNESFDQHLKISSHAQKRLDQRGYALADTDLHQLGYAVDELQEKGSENSLLLYKDLALIASVRNRTIITALDRDEVDTVTNIDSTKFVKENIAGPKGS